MRGVRNHPKHLNQYNMKTDLTQYDIKPEAMVNYLRYNGPHFNEKLCKFAVSLMSKKIGTVFTPITPLSKKEVDDIIAKAIMCLSPICVKQIFWGQAFLTIII